MSVYSYKATDISGKVIKGTLEAENEKGIVTKLQEMGYIPIRIHMAGQSKINADTDLSKSFKSFFSRYKSSLSSIPVAANGDIAAARVKSFV